MEQRYSESPKSSTSVKEKGSLSSLPSSKNIKFRTNESINSIERGQVYHTLSKDDNIGSTNKETQSTSGALSFQKTSDDNALVHSTEIDISQTITSKKSCINPISSAYGQPTEPNNESYF